MDWLFETALRWALDSAFLWIPAWVWIIAGGVFLGMLWNLVGWRGLLGGALAILTIGAWRHGYRTGRNLSPERRDDPVENFHPPDTDPRPVPSPRRNGGLLGRIFRRD